MRKYLNTVVILESLWEPQGFLQILSHTLSKVRESL